MFPPEALSVVSDAHDHALAPIPSAMPVVPVAGRFVAGAAGAGADNVAFAVSALAVSVDAFGYLTPMNSVGLLGADLDPRHHGPSFLGRVYSFVVDFSREMNAAPIVAAQWFLKSTR